MSIPMKIRNLIQELDKETPKGNEKMRVYYLENAKAEDTGQGASGHAQKIRRCA